MIQNLSTVMTKITFPFLVAFLIAIFSFNASAQDPCVLDVCANVTINYENDLVKYKTEGAVLRFFNTNQQPVGGVDTVFTIPGPHTIYAQAKIGDCVGDLTPIYLNVKTCSIFTQVVTCRETTNIDVAKLLGITPCASPSVVITSGAFSKLGAGVTGSGTNVVYAYATNAGEPVLGLDTVTFILTCGSDTHSGMLIISVVDCPDNIDHDADCIGDPPAHEWSMQMSQISPPGVKLLTYLHVIAGDIDGDGMVEIIAGANPYDSFEHPNGLYRQADSLYIFKGNDISKIWRGFKTTQPFSWHHRAKHAIVKTQIGGIDTVLIVVAESDRMLRAYNYNGTQVWASPTGNRYHSKEYDGFTPTFTDFNRDGIPEILIGGQLYNSQNGAFICGLPNLPYTFNEGRVSAGNNSFHSYVDQVADAFSDGNLKYVMGNYIYDVNINAANVITGFTLNKKINVPTTNWNADPAFPSISVSAADYDGGTVAYVDFDNDGKLYVFISRCSIISRPKINPYQFLTVFL